MVDLPRFFATAQELYGLWPSLFNWAAGLIVPFLVALATATWWMRGYKAEAREASLEGEKIALKGQIEILQQRLALAAEQQKVVTEQAKEFQAELAQLKTKVGKGESVGDLQLFTTTLGATLDKVVNSNNAVGSTLTLVLPDGPPVVIPARRDREGD